MIGIGFLVFIVIVVGIMFYFGTKEKMIDKSEIGICSICHGRLDSRNEIKTSRKNGEKSIICCTKCMGAVINYVKNEKTTLPHGVRKGKEKWSNWYFSNLRDCPVCAICKIVPVENTKYSRHTYWIEFYKEGDNNILSGQIMSEVCKKCFKGILDYINKNLAKESINIYPPRTLVLDI